jgi:hypothetical protein
MPPRILRPPLRPAPIVVPKRVAYALRPSIDRSEIPTHIDLSTNAPPFSGELREEQYGQMPGSAGLPDGASIPIVGLRRAWEFIGFIVDPGSAAAPGLTAAVRVLTRGINGIGPQFPVVNGVGPQAFTSLLTAARCELVLFNATGAPIFGLRASIWGMGLSNI